MPWLVGGTPAMRGIDGSSMGWGKTARALERAKCRSPESRERVTQGVRSD